MFGSYVWNFYTSFGEVLISVKIKMTNTAKYGLAKMLISYEMIVMYIISVVLLDTSG